MKAKTILTTRRLANVHPGEVLREEFLVPLGITPYRLAKSISVQQTRISEVLDGKRSITPDTAVRLGRYFDVSPQFWMNLQQMYDIELQEADPEQREIYDHIRHYSSGSELSRRPAVAPQSLPAATGLNGGSGTLAGASPPLQVDSRSARPRRHR